MRITNENKEEEREPCSDYFFSDLRGKFSEDAWRVGKKQTYAKCSFPHTPRHPRRQKTLCARALQDNRIKVTVPSLLYCEIKVGEVRSALYYEAGVPLNTVGKDGKGEEKYLQTHLH